ncbi:MAG TPA: hypothetical protein VER11_03785 [Polyangiaceae bacterium]|nr:hypothetical protein [Polyangiaceae bacterium]
MTDIVRETIAALIAGITPQSSTPDPPFGYGVDLVCVSDIDNDLRETDPNSVASIAQDCFHRLTTPRGSIEEDPNFGFDVRALLSVGLTQSFIRSLEGQISGELQKDDRIAFANVTLTQSGSATAPTFTVALDITPHDPSLSPFRMITSVADGEALLLEILK